MNMDKSQTLTPQQQSLLDTLTPNEWTFGGRREMAYYDLYRLGLVDRELRLHSSRGSNGVSTFKAAYRIKANKGGEA